MSNQVEVKKQFKDVLTEMVSKGAQSFPKGVNSDRLKINALMYINQDQKLAEMAQRSPMVIAQYVYNFISLGLDMLNRECYIIPYKDKLTVLKDYKGEIKLAKMYSVNPIREIIARIVCQNDEYFFNENDHFIHKFDPFSTSRGEKVGAFCTIIYENGVRQTEFVNPEEIKKIKAVSQSANSEYSPWKKWEDEMWKKTVIKKAMKNISLDFNSSEIQNAYLNSDNDVTFARKTEQEPVKQKDVFDAEDAVLVEPEEVDIKDV